MREFGRFRGLLEMLIRSLRLRRKLLRMFISALRMLSLVIRRVDLLVLIFQFILRTFRAAIFIRPLPRRPTLFNLLIRALLDFRKHLPGL
jgi:hypothetical protein